jgi:electron transfer flavoprotein alpha subunit
MLKARTSLLNRVLARSYATAASPHALVFLEHRQGDLDSASLSALTAASQLGGQVTGLVVGSPEEVPSIVEKAKKYAFKLPRIRR